MNKLFAGVLVLLLLKGESLVAQNWPQLDAVVYNNISDKYYFFYGKYCVIKERGKYIDGLPLLITEEWEGFPKSWHGGNIDAVCFVSDNVVFNAILPGMPKPTGKYYFFKGDEVCSKEMGEPMSKPTKIKDTFAGLPWPTVDAVTFNQASQTYYFFKGDEFTSKKKGEPVNKNARSLAAGDGFKNLDAKRPIRAVDYSNDNKDYYFFWDDYYMIKPYGEDIKAGKAPTRYEGDGPKGFEWAERSNDNFVGVANESGYFATFTVTWKDNSGKSQSWTKKGTALTYEYRLKLPKNVTDVEVTAYVWDVVKQENATRIFSQSYPTIPPNRWFKVYGTVFDPEYKIDKKSTNLLGSVETFFTKDVANAFDNALDDLNNSMNEAQYAIVKELAKKDAQKYKDLIDKLGKAAQDLIKNDPGFVDGLFRAAKDKSTVRNGDFVKQLVRRKEMAEVVKATGFKTLSVGFTSGASAVIGTEGAFGYGVSFDATQVKGFAGLDGSLGVQSGVGAGVQFGIWTSPPAELDGPGVAASVEVGSGVGVSFSIAYNITIENDIPKFTFGGIVVTPSVGAGVGASVGSGYSWVY